MENYSKLIEKEEFKEALRDKKLCLFLGAGVGCNIGMPNWKGLAYEITNFCLSEKIINNSCKYHLDNNANHPEKVISYCIQEIERKRKKEEFKKRILEKFFVDIPNNNFKNNNVYQNLIEIYATQRVLFVQTNYDSIIENNSKGARAFIPYLNGKIQELDNGLIVYLHGKYDKRNDYTELVLSRSMYNSVYVIESSDNDYYRKQRSFINKLLEQYFIIFLGYSLEDREIVQLIANRKTAKITKKICIISDLCEANKIDLKIQAEYIKEATNGQVECYFYDTEELGFKAFESVVRKLKEEIIHYKEPINLQKYLEGEGIKF